MFERKNQILITGEITTEAANELQKQVSSLAQTEPKKITFIINSSGGSVVAGLAMYDTISALTNIETEAVIMGICGSAATYPALACDKVKMQPNATFFVHLCEGGLYGTIEEIQNDLIFFQNLQSQVLAIYAVKTGRTTEEIYNEIHAPKYYTAEQALNLGWIDEITTEGVQFDLTNKMTFSEDFTNKITETAAPEDNTPIFSLKNIIKKCKELIKFSEPANEDLQNKLDEKQKQLDELQNKLNAYQVEREAMNAELKNRLAEIELAKSDFNNALNDQVNKRLANMGYNLDELPEPKNDLTPRDFRKIVKQQGLNAALNLL